MKALRRLQVSVSPSNFDERLSDVLAAVAAHCPRLEAVTLDGAGWRTKDLSALLQGGAPLRELKLDQCAALEAVHLPQIAALPGLRLLRLPSRLLGQPGFDDLSKRKGLDLRWQY